MNIDDEKKARASRIAVYYYVFDLIHLAGYDVSKLSLRHRKGLLRKALSFSDPIRFTMHRNEDGEEFLKEACRKGWEGLIAKDAGSAYVHSRSKKWLKFKCVNRQEFVIGGYTDPHGERIGFGALLIGYYKDGDLRFAGKVGTGYDDEMLRSLGSRLESLERKTPPFKGESLPSKGVHWVTPRLVGEVGFTEWTDEGRLRHPRFLGLRRDKKPKHVRRESGVTT
jgi:DNA ligase D-like protein (predicted ligase)